MSIATRTFGPDDLDRLLAQHPDVRMIDVRTPGEFSSGHIRGSYNVPLPDLPEHRRELRSRTGGPVVLICRSGRRADSAGEQLVAAGLPDVHVLDGGVLAWEASGRVLATAVGGGWDIERQVRFTAGAIVLAAVGVSIWWMPARFVAGALGLGLVIAAATDTCAMGNLLARLPFNRRRGASCDLSALVSTITADPPSGTVRPSSTTAPEEAQR